MAHVKRGEVWQGTICSSRHADQYRCYFVFDLHMETHSIPKSTKHRQSEPPKGRLLTLNIDSCVDESSFNIQILQTTQICATIPRIHSTTNLSYFFFLLYSLIHSSFPSCSLPFIIFLKLRGQHRTQLITRKTFPLTTHIITLKSIQQTPQLFCSVLTQQHRSHAFMRQQLQLSIPH